MPAADPMSEQPQSQSGNVIFFILLGIVLLGLVTAALRSGGLETSNIDRETRSISISKMKDQANSFERAVAFIMQNGASETDIRFSHADAPSEYGSNPGSSAPFQVFSRAGGGAEYVTPPTGLQIIPGPWEFYGHTSLPQVGSSAPELVAVLPNLTESACTAINSQAGYTATPQDDGGSAATSGCIYSGSGLRFSSSVQYSGAPNGTLEASFSIKPATQGCIECSADGSYHYFRVLLAR